MSAKNTDDHNRWRNVTVAFRMSPEEAGQLDAFVQMSGLPKQDYLIQRALQREVVVVGTPRVYKGLRIQMEAIHDDLQRISTEHFIPARLKVLLAEKKVTGFPAPSHREAAETWVWPGRIRSWWISSEITCT